MTNKGGKVCNCLIIPYDDDNPLFFFTPDQITPYLDGYAIIAKKKLLAILDSPAELAKLKNDIEEK